MKDPTWTTTHMLYKYLWHVWMRVKKKKKKKNLLATMFEFNTTRIHPNFFLIFFKKRTPTCFLCSRHDNCISSAKSTHLSADHHVLLKSWWLWTYKNSAVKRASAKVVGNLLKNLVRGSKKINNIVSLGISRYKLYVLFRRKFPLYNDFKLTQNKGYGDAHKFF